MRGNHLAHAAAQDMNVMYLCHKNQLCTNFYYWLYNIFIFSDHRIVSNKINLIWSKILEYYILQDYDKLYDILFMEQNLIKFHARNQEYKFIYLFKNKLTFI